MRLAAQSAVSIAAAILLAAPCRAGYVEAIIAPTSGSTDSVSAGQVLTGTALGVPSLIDVGLFGPASIPVADGLLSFSTGVLVMTDPAGDEFFAGGGSIVLTTLPNAREPDGVLFSGLFLGTGELTAAGTFDGLVAGQASPLLTAIYPDLATGASGFLSLNLLGSSPSFTSLAGGLVLAPVGVPEPGSTGLLAVGVALAVAAAGRRSPLVLAGGPSRC